MSIFLKIGAIALIYMFFSVILKSYRPEYVFLMRIFVVVLIFTLLIENIKILIEYKNISITEIFNIVLSSENFNLLFF